MLKGRPHAGISGNGDQRNMGWLLVIGLIVIVAALLSGNKDTDAKEYQKRDYMIDEEDPNNPHYEEMQEEFFDEFEQ